MENNINNSSNRTLISILIIILSIIVFQQIINLFFPDEGIIRLIANLILNTMLIVVSLVAKNTIVANSLLVAGFIRFVFVFFQSWNGGSAVAKPLAFGFILIVLITVAIVKFGHLNDQPKEV